MNSVFVTIYQWSVTHLCWPSFHNGLICLFREAYSYVEATSIIKKDFTEVIQNITNRIVVSWYVRLKESTQQGHKTISIVYIHRITVNSIRFLHKDWVCSCTKTHGYALCLIMTWQPNVQIKVVLNCRNYTPTNLPCVKLNFRSITGVAK
jgi:hypothetical protein